MGVRGENYENKRDTNEARRAGDWEMVWSISEPTGDWFGSSRGRRHRMRLSEKWDRLHAADLCGVVRVVELIEWIGQVQR